MVVSCGRLEGSIAAAGSLTGSLSAAGALTGTLSPERVRRGKLEGRLSAAGILMGALAATGALTGTLTIAGFVPVYEGPCVFTPGDEAQTVSCAGLLMPGDVVIEAIPSNYGKITWNSVTLTVS